MLGDPAPRRAMPMLKTACTRDGRDVTSQLSNWSGTYQFTAREVIAAQTISDVQKAVAAGGRVRAIGTRHSFNDLADNGATLISVTGIAPDPVIDEAARTVTVGAGTSYGALAAWLAGTRLGAAQPGLAAAHLHRRAPPPPAPTAQAAATRSCPPRSPASSTWRPTASCATPTRNDPDFDGMPVGLGAFGIVVRVTLDIEPSYEIRQDAYTGLTWDRVLADPDAVMNAAYSVSLFTDWTGPTLRAAWVKRRIERRRQSRRRGVLRRPARPGPGAVHRRAGGQPHDPRRRGPVVAAPAALPPRQHAEQRRRDPVGVLRRQAARRAAPLRLCGSGQAESRRCCRSPRSAPSPPTPCG